MMTRHLGGGFQCCASSHLELRSFCCRLVWSSGSRPVSRVPPATHRTVNHIAPHHGPANGGTAVAIAGANLTGATAVDFGDSPRPWLHVVSHRVIIAKSPPGSGVVDITVTTPMGTSTTGKSDQFTYNGQRCAGRDQSSFPAMVVRLAARW